MIFGWEVWRTFGHAWMRESRHLTRRGAEKRCRRRYPYGIRVVLPAGLDMWEWHEAIKQAQAVGRTRR